MCTCIKNMRQDRNDAELMRITGTLQNILINYLEEKSRNSMTERPGSLFVTGLLSNSLITPSCKVVSIETTSHKSSQISSTSLVLQYKSNSQSLLLRLAATGNYAVPNKDERKHSQMSLLAQNHCSCLRLERAPPGPCECLWAQGEPAEAACAVDEDIQATLTTTLVLWDLSQKWIFWVTCTSGLQPLIVHCTSK